MQTTDNFSSYPTTHSLAVILQDIAFVSVSSPTKWKHYSTPLCPAGDRSKKHSHWATGKPSTSVTEPERQYGISPSCSHRLRLVTSITRGCVPIHSHQQSLQQRPAVWPDICLSHRLRGSGTQCGPSPGSQCQAQGRSACKLGFLGFTPQIQLDVRAAGGNALLLFMSLPKDSTGAGEGSVGKGTCCQT